MQKLFSPSWFCSTFCLSYLVLFAQGWPLFFYYPLVKTFSLSELPADAGPPMLWYGLLSGAALIGMAASLVCKESWIPARLANWLWVLPVVTMTAITYMLRVFFS